MPRLSATRWQTDAPAPRRPATLARLDGLAKAGRTDHAGLKAQLRAQVEKWKTLLGDRPEIARQALSKLLTGRLAFRPAVEPDGSIVFVFEGPATFAPLLAGVVNGYGGSGGALERRSLTSGDGVPDGIRHVLPGLPIRGEVYRRAA